MQTHFEHTSRNYRVINTMGRFGSRCASPCALSHMERIIDTAAETGCHLEINSSPMRLNLPVSCCRLLR